MATSRESRKGDFLFDAFFSGGIGGTVVALALLGLDSIRGEPFRTPNLLGTVLFTDLSASEASTIRFDLVTWATVAHFVAFGLLGVAISVVVSRVELLRTNLLALTVVLLLTMEIGIRVVSAVLAPDLVTALGAGRILAANLAASLAMAGILVHAHREEPAGRPATPAGV